MKSPDDVLYLKQRFHKNRSPLGRFLDALSLRLLFFLSALILFSRQVSPVWVRLILSGIALSCFMILLHIISRLRYEAFVQKETNRVQRELFFRHLWKTSDDALISLAAPLLRSGERLVILHRVEQADGDDALEATFHGPRVALLSTGGFTASAETFAQCLKDRLRLISPEQLVKQAEGSGKLPTQEAVSEEMARRYTQTKEKRKRVVSLAFSGSFPGKYFLTSGLFILLSFFTGYALYYRLLALFSSCIAVVGAILSRNQEPHPHFEKGI